MQILANNLTFKGLFNKRPNTERIVIHHSASGINTTIQDMHNWHLNRGWSGLGYHYIIYADGTIYHGRPEWAKGAHAYQDKNHEANTDGIGICLIGNFMTDKPSETQLISLVWLIKDIWNRYSDINVIGHKDVMATACPGVNMNLVELRKRLESKNMAEQWQLQIMNDAKKAGLITSDHDPNEKATKWFVLAVMLNMLEIVRGEK